MLSHLLISVISDDKPGVVEALADCVSENDGNWLESRLSQLSGKFAGVIRVAVAAEKSDALQTALASLDKKNIWIKTEVLEELASQPVAAIAFVHVLGPDRPGIVRELSKSLVKHQINLASLETSLSSMPYSGEPLFDAVGELELPESLQLSDLHNTMDSIADALGLDISVSETPFDPTVRV